MHGSAGAIIKNSEGKILMIDRATPPFGWACPAGHIDDGETPEIAVRREIFEEVGLVVSDAHLIFHEFVEWNECNKGVRGHDWFLFEVAKWEGELVTSEREVKDFAWRSVEEIKNSELEKVWKYWFEKLNII